MSEWFEDEFIDTPETEIVEENIYVDEELIKNKSLVRMDMNLIQYPLFSKNTKRKINQVVKYFFNKNRDTYINVVPMAGDYIPGEAEEKVFIALMKIMKSKGMSRRFIVTASELKKELHLNTKAYSAIVRDSLKRLSSANYQFKNTLYSNKKNGILSKETHTTILSLKILTLDEKDNKDLRKKISDKRIKEVYEISVSDHFYDNIVTKGYLVYDSDILLSIGTSTARTIYMLIEKLRFNQLYLKIDTIFLIKRIPLKCDKRNITQTIKTLEKNLNELLNKKLIEKFNFIKDSTWENSEIEVYFSENVIREKQDRFFGDLNDFRKISSSLEISGTEHALIASENTKIDDIEKSDINKNLKKEITKEVVEEIFNLMPKSAKKLKTISKTIMDSLEKYGYEKVMRATLYIKRQEKLTSTIAYFLKTLENNWADDILIKETEEKVKIVSSGVIDEDIPDEKILERLKNLQLKFEDLSLEEKVKIEQLAFESYIEKCGANTKIQSIAFKAGKRKIILDYLNDSDYFDSKIIKFDANKNSYKIKEELKPTSSILTKEFLELAKQYIANVLLMLGDDLSKEEIIKVKMTITTKVMTENIRTIEDIQKKLEEILLKKN